LKKYQMKNIVLDPVMAAQSGASLLEVAAIDTLKKYLLPLVTVFTPNLPEASVLLNREVHNLAEMHKAAKDLTACGCESVLIKGGHLVEGDSTDLLYIGPEDRFVVLKGERISTRNNHGTGCTLSSALAAYLATGVPLEEAAQYAKEYMTGAIRAGAEYEIGHGHGPVHHFYKFW
jgi:hydroxymethylpyrimidine/phosphomethylpyrimidine kinase